LHSENSLKEFAINQEHVVLGQIVFVGITPHPPLLVPEVGGSRIAQVAKSQVAMREFSRRLVDAKPQTVVVISPHSPLDPGVFNARSTAVLTGDFGEFSASAVGLTFPNDLEMVEAIKQAAPVEGVELRELDRDYQLDHGALVPLYYLHEAGWRGPIVSLGFTLQSNEKHLAFGRAIAAAAKAINRPIALVASGDLSHRLLINGPYDYEPTAHLFDEQIVDAIARGDASGVIDVDSDLRNRAGECGYRSIVIALGAIEQNPHDHQVLSYEGPFGVGYMVAVLADANRRDARRDGPPGKMSPQDLARLAIETFIREGTVIKPPANLHGILATRAGVFVTLRSSDGQLRGCIGTIEPARAKVAEEIVENAIRAATRDPRFPSVSPTDLPDLRYGVDILSPPEPVRGTEDLDPLIYGVIVATLDDKRHGLLLPRIEGIRSVEEQWQAVHLKAGITPGTAVHVERFTVTRFGEH
jgi:MEMO1 family protein